jgi:Holliday junction resolvasome RuvABC DNA-binding subunit
MLKRDSGDIMSQEKITKSKNRETRLSQEKDDRLIYIALVALGYEGEALEREFAYVKSHNIDVEKLMDRFVKKIDHNPCAINNCNCPEGKCLSCNLFSRIH